MGWRLLIVENEANGDSRSTYERGPSLVDSLGSSCQYKRFLSWLVALVSQFKIFFFPHRTLLHFIWLSLNLFLWVPAKVASPCELVGYYRESRLYLITSGISWAWCSIPPPPPPPTPVYHSSYAGDIRNKL